MLCANLGYMHGEAVVVALTWPVVDSGPAVVASAWVLCRDGRVRSWSIRYFAGPALYCSVQPLTRTLNPRLWTPALANSRSNTIHSNDWYFRLGRSAHDVSDTYARVCRLAAK